MKQITPGIIQQIHNNLVEFGYSGLPLTDVEDVVTRIKAGEIAAGDIIMMMARGMLEENAYLEKA